MYLELLLQPQLPWLMRLKANVNLVKLFDDWRQKESHYHAAEDAYQQSCRIAPDGDEETDDVLRTLRRVLDETRDELERSKPSSDIEHVFELTGLRPAKPAAPPWRLKADIENDETPLASVSRSVELQAPPEASASSGSAENAESEHTTAGKKEAEDG